MAAFVFQPVQALGVPSNLICIAVSAASPLGHAWALDALNQSSKMQGFLSSGTTG